MKVDEAAIENARVQLSYCYIRSPIDGRAGQRLVDIGNVVNPGNFGNASSLLVIQRVDPIYADFTVPQNDLSNIQRNMAQATLRAEVRLSDEPNNPVVGELTFLDNAVKYDRRQPPGDYSNRDRRTGDLSSSRLEHCGTLSVTRLRAERRTGSLYMSSDDLTARGLSLRQRQGDQVVIDKGLKTESG
jgi:multidrug efflux system membrane fusion protein